MSINPKVSVIIPVYKAEQYIEKCARSLFEQTLDDIEFIFIDDCTPDNSIDILKCLIRDYPHRKSQVKIIHNEENKGISTTRNIGLNNSTGEYIIHCDSDDWIDDDLYEKLYLKAIEEKSDIVLCDFIREESGNLKIRKEFLNENVEEYVKAILTTKLSPYLWNKLVSRNLYLKYNIFFPDGINIREDFYVLLKLFFYSKKISKILNSYYYYRIHSISISRSEKMRDFNSDFVQSRIKASILAYEFLEAQDKEMKYEDQILDSKLILKSLIVMNVSNLKKALEIFPETKSKIFKSNLSLHYKIILWSLSKNINIFFRIYKMYYSIRY